MDALEKNLASLTLIRQFMISTTTNQTIIEIFQKKGHPLS